MNTPNSHFIRLYLLIVVISFFGACNDPITEQSDANSHISMRVDRQLLYGKDDMVRIRVEVNSQDILNECEFSTNPPNFASVDSSGFLKATEHGLFNLKASYKDQVTTLDFEVFPINGLGLKSPDAAFTSFLKKYQVVGGVVGFFTPNALTYIKAFGYANREQGVEMMPYHRLRIASVSKPITATAIMKLVEENHFQLDDYAFDLLEDTVEIADPRLLSIRIRHLLNHTAGWDRELVGDPMFKQIEIMQSLELSEPANPSQIIRWVKRQPLQTQPGISYAYSNVGYLILGRIIEKFTGKNYSHAIDSLLFQHADIEQAEIGFSQQINRLENEVHYYNRGLMGSSLYSPGDQAPIMYEGMGGSIESMDSHGGWVMSMPDLARFAIRSDGNSSVQDFLQTNAFNTMIFPNSSGYALGWNASESSHSHTGGLPGTASFIFIDRQRNMGLVSALNATPIYGTTENRDFFDEYTQLLVQLLRNYSHENTPDYFNSINF
jgi:CubicO group peptidase (beta-lactamase class C family)